MVYLAVNLMAVQITTVKNWRVSRADIQNILSRGAEGILEARRGAIIIVLKRVTINVNNFLVIKRQHILLSPIYNLYYCMNTCTCTCNNHPIVARA